jgi:hypothetical protein
MNKPWLAPGEEILDSWNVFVGDPGPTTKKITGKLHLTGANLHFEAGLALKENAATLISQAYFRRKTTAFEKLEDVFSIPLAEVAGAQSVKKSFFSKALTLRMKSGEEVEFQFGAASPQKAAEAIASRL